MLSKPRQAFTPQPQSRLGLGPGPESHRRFPFERRHHQGGAERGIGYRDDLVPPQIGPAAPKPEIWRGLDNDEEVARLAGRVVARLAVADDRQRGAVFAPRRDRNGERLRSAWPRPA
jgi:hypothetical protein